MILQPHAQHTKIALFSTVNHLAVNMICANKLWTIVDFDETSILRGLGEL